MEDKWLWVKESIVGPLVVATVVGSIGLGIGAWNYANGLSHRLTREIYRNEQFVNRVSTIERRFEEFRKPGDRFTASDGEHLREDIDKISQRVDVVDNKCQQCREKVGRIETKIEYFHK